MELSNQQLKYVNSVLEHASDLGIDTTKTDYSRAELRQVSMRMKGKVWIPNWITHDLSRRVSRGVFSIPEIPELSMLLDETPEIVDDLSEIGNEVVVDDMPEEEEQVSIPVMTSNAIPTITSEDMIAMSNL